jgi:sterol desaturase/sphingolipid hydroxylase (fatty acid hydroxylase superfamily)
MPDTIELKASESRGPYRPETPAQEGHPLFRWPPNVPGLFKWLFGFPGLLWPWHAFFVGLALVSWNFTMPDIHAMKTLTVGLIAVLSVQNFTLLVVFVGSWHLLLYVIKSQGTRYKYTTRWLSVDNPTFLFCNQLWDNVFWNLCCGVPIWTAYETVTLWLQANGYVSTLNWQAHPMYCVLLAVLMPFWADIHFYTIHRLIHWAPLYRSVHYLHHKNINFGPWSGLAMHPLEHLLYFSSVAVVWIIPAHPVHGIFILQNLALGASLAHLGFGRVVVSRNTLLSTEDYMHFMHHRYVTANYGVDVVPFDRWFGTFNDGSDQAQEVLRKRARERAALSRKP